MDQPVSIMNSIITMITDFGTNDHYVGVMKGVVLGINPDATIVDISHGVRQQDIRQGAYLLRSSYRYFPPGTIHLVVIDPGVGSTRKPIIIETKNYYFVGPDNGVLYTAACDDGIKQAYEISDKSWMLKDVSHTFHGRDIFSPTAAYLSRGRDPSKYNEKLDTVVKMQFPTASVQSKKIQGEVITSDRFGNLVTNIRARHIDRLEKQAKGRLLVRIGNDVIEGLSTSYAQVKVGQLLAIIGSSGLLEISVNQGKASDRYSSQAEEPTYVEVIIE